MVIYGGPVGLMAAYPALLKSAAKVMVVDRPLPVGLAKLDNRHVSPHNLD